MSRTARARTAVAMLCLAAGCAAPAVAPPAPTAVGVAPDAGGLQPVGSALRIDFGRAEAGVLSAVSRLKGARPEAGETGPGCNVAVWGDGLRLVFVDGDFRGWSWDGRSTGVTCG